MIGKNRKNQYWHLNVKWSILEGWPSRRGCCKGDFINLKDINPRRRKEANTSDQKVLISPITWMKVEPKRLNVDENREKQHT